MRALLQRDDVDGVVLAGGRGRRFGRPKATVRVGSATLVEHAVAALSARCRRVVVVVRPDTPLPPLEVPVVTDDPGTSSALLGIVSGLRAVDAPLVAVLGCDLLAVPGLLDRIVGHASAATTAAEDEHGLQPLCARYRRAEALSAASELLSRGELRLRPFLDSLGPVRIPSHEGELRNVNTWIDGLAAALEVPAPSSEVIEAILDLTRIVAHGTERPNGPVASFLAGYLAATSGDSIAAVSRATRESERLVERD